MNTINRIIKNISITGISQVILSLLGFLFLIYIARYLGEAEFGVYNLAISLTSIFVIFSDIGISQLIVREIARNKKLSSNYLTNASFLKVILSLITFVLIVLTSNLLGYPADVNFIIYLFGIYTILSSFSQMFIAFFQAFEKMEYVALLQLLEKLLLLSLGFVVLLLNLGLLFLSYIYVIVGIFDIVIGIYFVLHKITNKRAKLDYEIMKNLISTSVPFGLNALFGMLFFRIDTVILSILINDVAVGIYSAAYNPLLTLSMIISGMVSTSIYPVMSRYFLHSKDYLEKFALISSKYLAIIGFPIAVLCFVFADKIIILFYAGQYINSIIVFQILSVFIPLRLISSITGTLLTSIDKQGMRTFSVGTAALLNTVLNLALIPSLSYVGAAITTIISELFLYLIILYFIRKYYSEIQINSIYFKPCFSSLIMGLFLFYFRDMNIFVISIFASLIYFALLFLLNTFNDEDKYLFKEILKSIKVIK
jgi:O-antigen/teichoic acid export membrane protein